MRLAKSIAAALLCGLGLLGPVQAADAVADPWLPLARFIGEWAGVSSGEPGDGQVTRQYSFVMNKLHSGDEHLPLPGPSQEQDRRSA